MIAKSARTGSPGQREFAAIERMWRDNDVAPDGAPDGAPWGADRLTASCSVLGPDGTIPTDA